jgi:hypothetical protein
MQIYRKWYNGIIDYFSFDELQRSIIKPLSKAFERPRKYNPLIKYNIEILIYENPEPLDGEYFIEFRYPIYASNYSRIKNVKTNKVLLPDRNTCDIIIPEISYEDKLYKIIAQAFFIKPELNEVIDIHHISGNFLDNQPDNLIYITRSIHGELEPDFKDLNKKIKQKLYIQIEQEWHEYILKNEIGYNTSYINEIGYNTSYIKEINIDDENLFSDIYYDAFKFWDVSVYASNLIGGTNEKSRIQPASATPPNLAKSSAGVL